MMRDLYSTVSNLIAAQLEAGAVPWVKPWAATPGKNRPFNAKTNRPYSGCNVVLLWIAQSEGWKLPGFVTFKQALDLGGNVKKGEHGIKVYFVKKLIVKGKPGELPIDAGDESAVDGDHSRSIPMMREYTVFNVAQCEGLPDKISAPDPVAPRHDDERDATADEFMRATGADIREGGADAFFSPSKDFVNLPSFEAFKSAHHFYSTAFHELGHWTGHKSRLDRFAKGVKFGDRAYAAEELVAELTSAFLCAEFSYNGDLRHAGYIAHWIELLKNEPRAFFYATSKAQAAADYMRGLALKDETPVAEVAA